MLRTLDALTPELGPMDCLSFQGGTAFILSSGTRPQYAPKNASSSNSQLPVPLSPLPFRRDQNLVSTVNCWYLVLEQTRRESRDHATLSDIYNNNVIVRLAHVGEDVIRLFKKVRAGIEAGPGTQSGGG